MLINNKAFKTFNFVKYEIIITEAKNVLIIWDQNGKSKI